MSKRISETITLNCEAETIIIRYFDALLEKGKIAEMK
jgi:hypothetical protein